MLWICGLLLCTKPNPLLKNLTFWWKFRGVGKILFECLFLLKIRFYEKFSFHEKFCFYEKFRFHEKFAFCDILHFCGILRFCVNILEFWYYVTKCKFNKTPKYLLMEPKGMAGRGLSRNFLSGGFQNFCFGRKILGVKIFVRICPWAISNHIRPFHLPAVAPLIPITC